MAKEKLRGKDLKKIGYTEHNTIALALNLMIKYFKRSTKMEQLELLEALLNKPEAYLNDPVLCRLVDCFQKRKEIKTEQVIRSEARPFHILGKPEISGGALKQMETAMKLPIAEKGALMPDAHHGYGLPIGGVLATKNALIPYAVGMDIGCRMAISVYDLPASYLDRNSFQLKTLLKDQTRFGEKIFDTPNYHPVLDRDEFKETRFLQRLKDKAWRQLGSSGSGNHFVEFGIVQLEQGSYLALLSHSGSRGFGAAIAQHYTNIAKQKCLLPYALKHMAWLDMNTEDGQAYWTAMNLAGDYAAACHQDIHQRMANYLGAEILLNVENHHNFAWKEKQADGEELYVHRKGATPAAKGQMGIIPGSMASPAFIVRGKGNPKSMNSASHGAGRAMSRQKAKNSFTKSYLSKLLLEKGITLIGGAVDESPMAYKDIHKVMQYQHDLVEVVGQFDPKIVRMDRAK